MPRPARTRPAPPEPALRDAQDEVADVFAEIAEFWGFTRTQGRIYGLIFMSPVALDQATVRDRLGISAGSASMTLHSLVDWGVLHQQGRVYVAETNLFQLVIHVMRRRERQKVEDAIHRVRALVERLDAASRAHLAGGASEHEQLDFARRRARHLLDFFELGRGLLEALVGRSAVRRILDRMARRSNQLRPVPFRKAGDHERARA